MLHLYGLLSDWGLAAAILGLFVVLALLTLRFYHRHLPFLRFEEGSWDYATIYGGAIGTIFALIFAFVIVAVWQNFDRVAEAVGKEAKVLQNVYRSLDGYPPDVRGPLQGRLRTYLDEVVRVEWPLLGQGLEDPIARQEILEVDGLLTQYRPPSAGEVPLHEQMLQLLALNRNLRQDRIKGGQSYLDLAMGISLLMGNLILINFSCMLNMRSRRQHYLMHATLGASMGLVCYLLLVYNFPFLGPGAIGPEPFKALLLQIHAS